MIIKQEVILKNFNLYQQILDVKMSYLGSLNSPKAIKLYYPENIVGNRNGSEINSFEKIYDNINI